MMVEAAVLAKDPITARYTKYSQCLPAEAAREPARVITSGDGIGAINSSIAAPTVVKMGRGTEPEREWR